MALLHPILSLYLITLSFSLLSFSCYLSFTLLTYQTLCNNPTQSPWTPNDKEMRSLKQELIREATSRIDDIKKNIHATFTDFHYTTHILKLVNDVKHLRSLNPFEKDPFPYNIDIHLTKRSSPVAASHPALPIDKTLCIIKCIFSTYVSSFNQHQNSTNFHGMWFVILSQISKI